MNWSTKIVFKVQKIKTSEEHTMGFKAVGQAHSHIQVLPQVQQVNVRC